MANGVFVPAKGRFAEKFKLPLGTDAIEIVLLKATGLQADTTLRAYSDLATLLASNAEADFNNYARKVLTGGITVAPSGTSQIVDIPDLTWLAAGLNGDPTLGKLITVYRATSSALDSDKLPLTYHDVSAQTSGSDLLAQISASGLASAA